MIRFSFSRLRVRLLLLVVLSVIPAFGLILYTAWAERRQEIVRTQEEALRLSQLTAANLQRLFEGTGRLLMMLAEFRAAQDGDPGACSALLAKLRPQYPEYVNTVVARPTGEVFCSAEPLRGPLNIADRASFLLAVETRGLIIGEYEMSRITGKPMIPIRYPLLDPAGRVRIVVSAALDLERLHVLVRDVQLPPGAAITVLNGRGRVVARYPEPRTWGGRVVADVPMVQAILTHRAAGAARRLIWTASCAYPALPRCGHPGRPKSCS